MTLQAAHAAREVLGALRGDAAVNRAEAILRASAFLRPQG